MTYRPSSDPMPSSARRTGVLLLLIVGLHLLVLLWAAPRLGASGGAIRRAPAEMQARLIAAPTPQPPPPPQPAPKPATPPPKKRARAQPPPVSPAPLAPAAVTAALASAAPAAIDDAVAPLPADGGAAAALTDVESLQVQVQPAPAPATAAAGAPSLTGQAYRTDVPPSARIVLDVARKDADGTLWHGEAAMAWQVDGGSYRMKLEAGIRVLVTRVNLVVLESSGTVGEAGFAPRTMTEKRRGRAATATRFGGGAGGDTITFTASPASYPMAPGTQDKATVPLQLAAIARGDSSQLEGNIDMLVGEDKDASVFRFVLVGEETLDTPLGRLATWHLSRPPRPGAYGSRLDVWLAPSLGWLPVRIDNIEASGATTTQTARRIAGPDG